MSHPDPNGPPDLTPIQVGEVWENPVTRERATILELPYENPEGRVTRRADRAGRGARRRASTATPPSSSASPCSRAS